MNLETEVGLVDVFDPEEFKQREISIENDLSWYEYWVARDMPIVWKQINRTYEHIMGLWDVSMDDALNYLNMLNKISSNLVDIHHRTLHY